MKRRGSVRLGWPAIALVASACCTARPPAGTVASLPVTPSATTAPRTASSATAGAAPEPAPAPAPAAEAPGAAHAAQPAPTAPAPAPAPTPTPAAPALEATAASVAAPPAVEAVAGPAASGGPAPSSTGTVTVDLIGVKSSQGQLRVALFRDARGFPDGGAKAYAKRVLRPRKGNVRVAFDEVPKGPFAVTVHHDEDGDGEMDTGLFGIPTEGYGFSRDASAPFGPPGFAACRVVLAAGENQRLRIHLRY